MTTQSEPSRSIRRQNLYSDVYRVTDFSLGDLLLYPADRKSFWKNPDNHRYLGLGTAYLVETNGLSRVTDCLTRLETLKFRDSRNHSQENPPDGTEPKFFGYVSFFPEESLSDPWSSFQPLQFVLPRFQIFSDRTGTWLTVNTVSPMDEHRSPTSPLDSLREFARSKANSSTASAGCDIISTTNTPKRERWISMVRETLERIRTSRADKIVLAHQLQLDFNRPLSLSQVLRELSRNRSKGFSFAYRNGDFETFLGLSPEKLLFKEGLRIESESLAGTTGNTDNLQQGESAARKLKDNPKDQEEHRYVADYIRDRLSAVTSSFEEISQAVRSLPEIQHLLTDFNGTLETDIHPLELVNDLHPTPAVGGYPAGQALKYLKEREPFARGLYASPVGWFDLQGNGEFAVSIRSALWEGSRSYLYCGAGIVRDSSPEQEWEELQLKYQSIKRFLLPQSRDS